MDAQKEKNKKFKIGVNEASERLLNKQRKQVKNTTFTISEKTNEVQNSIEEYQQANKKIFDTSIDRINKIQQETFHIMQTITNNYEEFQNNIFNAYQSKFSRFLDGIFNQSYWSNFRFSERHSVIHDNANQSILDNAIKATLRINELVLESTKILNRSIEVTHKYYNDSLQNYFNHLNKILKSPIN